MDDHLIVSEEKCSALIFENTISRIAAKVPKGVGPKLCQCGTEIHIQRRNLGYTNCYECQSANEFNSKQYRLDYS